MKQVKEKRIILLDIQEDQAFCRALAVTKQQLGQKVNTKALKDAVIRYAETATQLEQAEKELRAKELAIVKLETELAIYKRGINQTA